MRWRLALMALSLAGAAHAQAPAPNPTLNAYEKPWKLVDVGGGRKISIFCQGKGSPTVILTAGLGGWSSAWGAVQPQTATRTRACAWDRAGYGHSDGSPAAQTVENTTADLELALKAARINGPYVLVGHSAGAYESLRFADRHRADVVGLVLVDPSVPDQTARFAALSPELTKADSAALTLAANFQRLCGERVADGSIREGDATWKACFKPSPDDPPALVAAMTARDRQPGRFESKASLAESFAPNSAAVADPKRSYGDLPVIVLTQGKGLAPPGAPPEQAAKVEAAWIRWHDEYAALSTRGLNLIVRGSGHLIPQEKPQAITAAISAVLDLAK